MSGARKPITTWPDRSSATSVGVGLLDPRITSESVYSSAVGTTVAPASSYVASGIRRAGAGTALDEDVEPGGRQLAEHLGDQGNAALAGRVSLATPTFMGITCRLRWFRGVAGRIP